MTSHAYLYDIDEDNSKQGFINKLYSLIMENLFHGSNARLRWGDTIPKTCKLVRYSCKIDLRVTVSSKYYKDKVKIVLCSAIRFKKYQKSKMNFIPFMLISRLEGELLVLYQSNQNWFIVDKVADVYAPNTVELMRNGEIKNYVKSLKYFKDHCMHVKNKLNQTKSMKSTGKARENIQSDPKKPFWFSNFKKDNSSDEED